MSTTSMEDVFKAGFACGVGYNMNADEREANEEWEKYRYDQLLRVGGKQVADEWLAARKKPKDPTLQALACPDCNGPMLPRSSQYGKFWGCASYPKCKGTRDSEGLSKTERTEQKRKEGDYAEDVPVESGELYKFKKG